MPLPRDVSDIHLHTLVRKRLHTGSLFLVDQEAEQDLSNFGLALFDRVLDIRIFFASQAKEHIARYVVGVPVRNRVQANRYEISALLAPPNTLTDRSL
jgi:hypothetical protein